jgi:hypothetical protein
MYITVIMVSKFYTIKFKNRIKLGLSPISIHFLTKVYLMSYHFMKKHLDCDPLPPYYSTSFSMKWFLTKKNL